MVIEVKHLGWVSILYIGVGIAILLLLSLFIYLNYLWDFRDIELYHELKELLYCGFWLYKVFVSFIMILLSVPSVICGVGMLLRKNWAIKGVQSMALVYCFFFPLGTLIGLYTFYILRKTELREVLANLTRLIEDVIRSLKPKDHYNH